MGGGKQKPTRGIRATSSNSAKAKIVQPGDIRDFFGLLAGRTNKVATIEEINEAAAAGWAGKINMSDDDDGSNPPGFEAEGFTGSDSDS